MMTIDSSNNLEFSLEFEEVNSVMDVGMNEVTTRTVIVNDHSQLENRESPDSHPISAITNLQTVLDSKLESSPSAIITNNLLVMDESGKIADSSHCCSDFALRSEVQEIETDKHYIYTQISAESVWNITHNLNKMPSVSVVDSSNNIVVGDITYINSNSVSVQFTGAFSGRAYLN